MNLKFIYWGDSPKRNLHRSLEIDENNAKKVMSYDNLIWSNLSSYSDNLPVGEIIWSIFNQDECKIFMTSHLQKIPNKRPLWYFLAIVISREEWKEIGSIKNFIAMFKSTFPKNSWIENEKLREPYLELSLQDTNAISSLTTTEETLLNDMEKHIIDDNIDVFDEDFKLAWNPNPSIVDNKITLVRLSYRNTVIYNPLPPKVTFPPKMEEKEVVTDDNVQDNCTEELPKNDDNSSNNDAKEASDKQQQNKEDFNFLDVVIKILKEFFKIIKMLTEELLKGLSKLSESIEAELKKNSGEPKNMTDDEVTKDKE